MRNLPIACKLRMVNDDERYIFQDNRKKAILKNQPIVNSDKICQLMKQEKLFYNKVKNIFCTN